MAHFYFVTIHPFEDGNGRIVRALTDMALAQDGKLGVRYYSLSSQIMEEREEYYRILEKSSKKDNLDITDWLAWFLGCYQRAIGRSDKIIHLFLFEKRKEGFKFGLVSKDVSLRSPILRFESFPERDRQDDIGSIPFQEGIKSWEEPMVCGLF